MEHFSLSQLLAQRIASQKLYLEFIRHPSLSVGLYEIPAGGVDPQQPHSEDEVYYVVRGSGQVQVGAEQRAVNSGDTVFVAAGVSHRFHSITEDLQIIVFFAPAEYTNKG